MATSQGWPSETPPGRSDKALALPTLAVRAAIAVLRDSGLKHTIVPFEVRTGSDERQYCSPGFDLPVGSLMRSMYGTYPEYHTSDDDKSPSFPALAQTVETYDAVARAIDANRTYATSVPYGEPQLGKRGLYPSLSQSPHLGERVDAMLWLLNQADGRHDLLAVAERSGCSVAALEEAARRLAEEGLVAPCDAPEIRS